MPEIEIWGGPLDGTVIDYVHAPEEPLVLDSYIPPKAMVTDVTEVVQTYRIMYMYIGLNLHTGRYLYSEWRI